MGIKDALAAPWVYELHQYLIRGTAYLPEFVSRYIKAKPGDRVLDMGCGTEVMLHYLPEVEYVGFDMSKTYIDACKKRFGNRGTFHQCEVKPDTITESVFTKVTTSIRHDMFRIPCTAIIMECMK